MMRLSTISCYHEHQTNRINRTAGSLFFSPPSGLFFHLISLWSSCDLCIICQVYLTRHSFKLPLSLLPLLFRGRLVDSLIGEEARIIFYILSVQRVFQEMKEIRCEDSFSRFKLIKSCQCLKKSNLMKLAK